MKTETELFATINNEEIDTVIVSAKTGLLLYSPAWYRYSYRKLIKKNYLSPDVQEKEFINACLNAEKALSNNSPDKYDIFHVLTLLNSFFSYKEFDCLSVDLTDDYFLFNTINDMASEYLRECKKLGKKIILLNDTVIDNDEFLAKLANSGFADLADRVFRYFRSYDFSDIEETIPEIKSCNYLYLGSPSKYQRIEKARPYYAFKESAKSIYDSVYMPMAPSCMHRYSSYISELINSDNDYEIIGASTFGPVLVAFAEWILNTSSENNISQIFPLMRDGYVMTRILRRMVECRNLPIEVKPLYVSRRALFMPNNQIPDADEYLDEQLSMNSQMTVGVLLKNIGIENQFCDEENSTKLSKIKSTYDDGGNCLYDRLLNVLKVNNEKLVDFDRRRLIYDYLKQNINIDEPYITVDFGFAGTIADSIDTILQTDKECKSVHLLLMGSPRQANVFFNGRNVKAFLWNLGVDSYKHSFSTFCYSVFENIMMNTEGTTLGYKSDNGKAIPILDETTQIDEKINDSCQKGIMFFLDWWLGKTKDNYELASQLIQDKEYYMDVIDRLLLYPNAMEAKALGDMMYENRYLDDENNRCVCNADNSVYLSQMPDFNYFLIESKDKSNWWAGECERLLPGSTMAQMLSDLSQTLNRRFGGIILKKLVLQKIKKVCVYGMAKKAELLINIFDAVGIEVTAIIDHSPVLQGESYSDIPIYTLETCPVNLFDSIVVCSVTYKDEICKEIYDRYGQGVSIITI